jgi:hypothetical protein
MDAGISFSPAQNQPTGQVGGGMAKPGATPLQDAIKLLSFKLPTNVGASAPSPSQIMGGPTPMGAQLGNGVANNWLMALFQGLNPAATGGFQARLGVPAYNPGDGSMAGMGAGSPMGSPMPSGGAPGDATPGGKYPVAVQFPQATTPTMPDQPAGPPGDRPWYPGQDFQQFGG